MNYVQEQLINYDRYFKSICKNDEKALKGGQLHSSQNIMHT